VSVYLYFSNQGVPPTLPALSPLVAANWTRALTLQRFRLTTNRPDASLQGSSKQFGGTTISSSAHYQWISDPLAAAFSLDGPAGLGFVMAAYQSTNETMNLTLNVRVIKSDGTLRGVFFHGYLPLVSLPADPVAVGVVAETRTIGFAGTTVACSAGDRIVAEIGFTATSAPAGTAQLLIQWGASDGYPDSPPTRGLTGWANPYLILGTDLAFAPDALPAVTRLYFSRNNPSSMTIAAHANWTRVIGTPYRQGLLLRRTDPADVLTAGVTPLGSSATGSLNYGQWFSPPLDRDQTIAGTATVVTLGFEQTVTENSYLAALVRIVKPDNTQRALLGSVIGQIGTEFGTSLQQRKAIVTLSSNSALKGDRICVELGVYSVLPGNTGTVGIEVGCTPLKSDCIGDETSFQIANPWVEFSQVLTFDTGTFLGLFDPNTPTIFGTTVDWPLNVVVPSFQEESTEFGGLIRRGFGRNLLSSQRGGKRAWRCTVDFATGGDLDRFLAFIDAAPGANVAAGVRSGSKVMQLYSDALGGLRSPNPQLVRVEAGQALAWENPSDPYRSNTGWSLDLVFRQV
jgi:hypothetical protein